MSEEQQRRLQQDRAQKRAARWRPQDELVITNALGHISKPFDEMQRTLLERQAASQKPVPFHVLMTVAVLEIVMKANAMAQCNRIIEARPLPPGAPEPKENEWSE